METKKLSQRRRGHCRNFGPWWACMTLAQELRSRTKGAPRHPDKLGGAHMCTSRGVRQSCSHASSMRSPSFSTKIHLQVGIGAGRNVRP